MRELTGLLINVGSVFVLLVVTYFVGGMLERRHYQRIRAREQEYRGFPVVNFQYVDEAWHVESTVLAQGSTVVSVDYFKRFVAGLRGVIGGPLKTYEPLLDRARREAVLRMIEDARRQGCVAVINVRLESSCLANAERSGRRRLAGVEMLAYGTGIKLSQPAPSRG
jgi:uncharacterized protein YbjQ (UPF0145 family)